MLYIAICFTLFALMGGVLLLSKAKTDAMGNLAKWVAWIVIVTSAGMFICEIGQACVRMARCGGTVHMEKHIMMRGGDGCGPQGMQYCPPEMCGGKACWMPMGHGRMGGGMHCGGDMDCCGGDMECCEGKGMGKGMMDEECGMHMKKMQTDSTK